MLQEEDWWMSGYLTKIGPIIFCHDRSNFKPPIFRFAKCN